MEEENRSCPPRPLDGAFLRYGAIQGPLQASLLGIEGTFFCYAQNSSVFWAYTKKNAVYAQSVGKIQWKSSEISGFPSNLWALWKKTCIFAQYF